MKRTKFRRNVYCYLWFFLNKSTKPKNSNMELHPIVDLFLTSHQTSNGHVNVLHDKTCKGWKLYVCFTEKLYGVEVWLHGFQNLACVWSLENFYYNKPINLFGSTSMWWWRWWFMHTINLSISFSPLSYDKFGTSINTMSVFFSLQS
jgi:hypothetical protein